MFSVVSGTVLHVERDKLVVDVNGLGIEVLVTEPLARGQSVGEPVTLHTLFQKRTDAMSLSGFASREELDLFTLVMDTPGLGAKTARSALGMLGYDGLVDSIRRGNEPELRKIPGVGQRAAAMLLVTLRPKLGTAEPSQSESSQASPEEPHVAGRGEALSALQALGWKKRDAVVAVDQAIASSGTDVGVETIIRSALSALGSLK